MSDPKLVMPKATCRCCKAPLSLIVCACGACTRCHPIGSTTCPPPVKRA